MDFRYNVMDINSLSTFARIKGGFTGGTKAVYFLRFLGVKDGLTGEVDNVDRFLWDAFRKGQMFYNRVDKLGSIKALDKQQFYMSCYEKWVESGKEKMELFPRQKHSALPEVLGDALRCACRTFAQVKPGVNTSMEKNFVIKILGWTDYIFEHFEGQWDERACMKLILSNISKEQEFIFAYMLTRLGADVLLLQTETDAKVPEEILNLSTPVVQGDFDDILLPQFTYEKPTPETDQIPRTAQPTIPEPVTTPMTAAQTVSPEVSVPPMPKVSAIKTTKKKPAARKEKSFEELACLASSIVMIAIHDDKGDVVATGSGIMIGKDGFILTNCHVIGSGHVFSVQIEDDDERYVTDEVIKVNQEMDLAVIRIQRELQPLPLYSGKTKLVRGQKVVAIGSPLGLFNTVSDGIISAFRTVNDEKMIQFTAPISHGSSGGAVLNMYGEIIGISTAGIDDGQNLNLAVPYDCIHQFAKNFL